MEADNKARSSGANPRRPRLRGDHGIYGGLWWRRNSGSGDGSGRALYILCGITGGFFAVLAIWKRHERSFLVYLALIPAALATFLVLGEILYLIVFVLMGRQIH
jgi:hypothetical protein